MSPKKEFKKFLKKSKNKKKSKNDKVFKSTGKRGRLIVRNLPYSITKEQLQNHFESFGKITEVNIPYHEGSNKPKGFGFVNFVSRLSADKATEALNEKEFMGRKLLIERAVDKTRFLANNSGEENGGFDRQNSDNKSRGKDQTRNGVPNEDEMINEIKEECLDDLNETRESENDVSVKEESANSTDFNGDPQSKKHGPPHNEHDDEQFPGRITKKKKARIIIRNLSFKTTENKLSDHFKKFGEIIDLQLLRRVDNKLVGCGFVEFNNKQSAAKAILETSGKPFLGRPIVVDWAIPAKEFRKVNKKTPQQNDRDVKIKEEVISDDEMEEKFHQNGKKSEDSSDVKPEVKEESSSEEDSDDDSDGESMKPEIKSDDDDDDDDDDEEEEDEDDDEDDYDSEEEIDNKNDMTVDRKPSKFQEPEPKKPRYESHDVDEGRTVFIKNVPFSATKEELAKCVRRMFGPIFYALICVDPMTEHSRGTAFVKFQKKEDAEKCLSAGTEFTLNGTVLDPHPAIDRKALKDKIDKEKEKNRDSRNLYLMKEGVVLAGTPAAAGVSATDMSLRLELEQWKGEMLKNLNMFVSRNRLIVHNLPPSYDDSKLRTLFKQHSRKGAKITEARVMRDLKNVDAKGVGLSKEYGFVTFEDFQDALTALRNINNNPKIFSENKRPVVSFSIENRRIINIKQKRLARSRVNNPLSKNFDPVSKARADARKEEKAQRLGQVPGEENNKNAAGNSGNVVKNGKNKRRNRGKNSEGNVKVNNEKSGESSFKNKNREEEDYRGVTAKPGKTKLRAKFKLKKQALTHEASLKKNKKEQKEIKKKEMLRKNPIKQKNPTSRKKVENDAHFNSLVNKYKTQLQSSKKWFE
ncbi:hypothetical protein LSTR_LSTR005014 [Laodelphax striatellus]|uniref:RRM domain-containing protein n=1 Tax=Laodelphax striatellus TaxID=195883 RepID=A0A482XJS8_LAOST|nr:hypothetical protein LSTR_LSTR005014 [Laodelphax striatellus]